MIFVSAGHYPSKPGASHGSFTEYDEAAVWANRIVEILDEAVLVPTGFLRQKAAFINARAPSLAIEIHFNSFKVWRDANRDGLMTDDEIHAAGRGSETLYYPGSEKGKRFAEIVQTALASVFQPDRGIKEGWYRLNPDNGPDFFLAKTSCPAVIVEPEFIHRKGIIQDNREEACQRIASALQLARQELT